MLGAFEDQLDKIVIVFELTLQELKQRTNSISFISLLPRHFYLGATGLLKDAKRIIKLKYLTTSKFGEVMQPILYIIRFELVNSIYLLEMLV